MEKRCIPATDDGGMTLGGRGHYAGMMAGSEGKGGNGATLPRKTAAKGRGAAEGENPYFWPPLPVCDMTTCLHANIVASWQHMVLLECPSWGL
jgi:hypothetical protein